MSVIVRFRKLRPEAVIPRYMTDGAAGMDLASASTVTVWPGSRELVHTWLAAEIPPGFEAQVRTRSGMALKYGLVVANSPGTVDSDYRGEIGVIIANLDEVAHTISAGERVAQMVIAPVVRAEIVEVEELSATERGAGGFGSTGSGKVVR